VVAASTCCMCQMKSWPPLDNPPEALRRGADRGSTLVTTVQSWMRATEENVLSPATVQAWVVTVTAVVGAILGLLQYFKWQTKRDRKAAVGSFFALTVDALASDNPTSRMAGAVLLRRFFDQETEQGASHEAYRREAVEVMAGMLREEQPPPVQKVLADGLRYARDLQQADFQNCDLKKAYVGKKAGDVLVADLSQADLFRAKCDEASFREVVAREAVFVEAELRDAVFIRADCREADFRWAKLGGSRFKDAQIGGAKFEGAEDIPEEVAALLDEHTMEGRPGAVVGQRADPQQ